MHTLRGITRAARLRIPRRSCLCVRLGHLALGLAVALTACTTGRPTTGPTAQSTPDATGYDVIVVGAGTGGVASALQSARQGARTALVEATDCIGGQMVCAGVSTMDGGEGATRTGIYREFVERVQTYYRGIGKSAGTCYWNTASICFEPHIGQHILWQMIDDTRRLTLPGGQHPILDVYPRTSVVAVSKSGNQVTGVTTAAGKQLRANVLVDATEDGYLLPLAGATYRVGKRLGPWTEACGCIQDITYVAIIKRYPMGVPTQLVLRSPPPGYAQARASFAALTAPGGYADGRYPWSPQQLITYRGLPDGSSAVGYDASQPAAISRSELNLANDFPSVFSARPGLQKQDHAGPTLSGRYLDDMAYRAAQTCAAKLRTLQYLYYVQHDLGYSAWSVADDEGFDTPSNEANSCPEIPVEYRAVTNQFPPLPYVRESRRGVGLVTVTAANLNSRTAYSDSIALGDYVTDVHNCSGAADLEMGLDHPGDQGSRPAPDRLFEVPLRALIAQSVTGLVLAEKNISVSRLAEGAIREQPITMATGQAAGALVAEAALRKIAPDSVPAAIVQDDLRAAHDTYAYPA